MDTGDISNKQIDHLLEHIQEHGTEVKPVADLAVDLAEEYWDMDFEVPLKCRKCGGKYIRDRHQLVEAFDYFYHERCVEDLRKEKKEDKK